MTRALLYCAGGGIGDSLVASVVARALRQRYATVDALTLAGHRETLERVPDLDEVLVDDGGDERALAATLAARAYDACVVTWATARTARIPQLARIPVRVGQARRLYSFRFTKRVVVRSELGDVTSHWSDILLDYARALDCDTADRTYRFEPTGGDREQADALLAREALGDGRFAILNPCNAIASKRPVWPLGGWRRVGDALAERLAMPVLVSGGSADAAMVATIAHESNGRLRPVAGHVGIGGFGALAQRARAFVGITTGSMHVASAVGCPTVGIFPFQSDFPERWAPMGTHTAIVRPSYPCHRGDTKERCADYACVANLDVAGIVAAAGSLVA